MKLRLWFTFGSIIILAILAGLADWPNGPNLKIGSAEKKIDVQQGLDLKGGVRLVYELDLGKINPKDRPQAVIAAKDVIDRRVNVLGVAEPAIYEAKTAGAEAVTVELPGVTEVQKAIDLIGKTAQLKFQEQAPDGNFIDSGLTGAHLKKAQVQFDQTTNEPQVGLQFNDEGIKLFSDITRRNLQKQVPIILDEEIISAPTVQTTIDNGQAVITGKFSIDEVKNLVKLLNAGALPVPIKLVEQRTIGATLGSESVKKSLVAALVGLFLVAIFMIVYYKIPGLLAVLALMIYTAIVLAIFKLIPVTLTLAGIAGFILSIGMAVDANVLVFERLKEELRAGKELTLALEEGFRRAWSSIRDSNVSSLITALILYYGTTGLVRGFAVTLAIGILISMFTAITVSRTFLRIVAHSRLQKWVRI